MSIEIHINKDVGSYDAKLIGPFTARQSICIAVAAPICWLIYKSLSPVITPDAAGFVTAIPAAVAWAFGWLKPYGMRTEKFVQSVFINMVLAPTHRKYKTVNAHENALNILERHAKALEAQQTDPKATKKTQKKQRYKVSREAVK